MRSALTVDTIAHCVINLYALERQDRGSRQSAAIAGAVLPDAPMFIFYFVERVINGTAEATIWRERYWDPGWQAFIDAFNSAPLILIGLIIAVKLRAEWAIVLGLSMVLHVVLDLLLHHDDGHRHLWPLSDWRFESPLSYWDGAHNAGAVSLVITVAVLACSVGLWRTAKRSTTRAMIVLLGGIYAAFAVFARLAWAS